MSDPIFHPQYFPELLEDEETVIPRRRSRFGFYDEQWQGYDAAGQPYGYCNDGMMEWLCEQRGIKTKAWFHVL
jgi:hypothetical protein